MSQLPLPCVALISSQDEARLFAWLRWRTLRAHVRHWMEESLLRLVVISVLCIVFWVALFASFAEGFQLLETAIAHVPTRATTVQHVFNVFFLTLLVMLTVSSAVIFYGVVFRGDEIRVLLTLPASAERIVLFKLQETTLFSCWGFFLVGSPMLIAYGVVAAAPWYYYAMLLPFIVAFVTIPTTVGTLLCLGGVYLLPSIRVHAATILCTIGVVATVAFGWLLFAAQTEDMLTAEWLSRMNSRMQFAEQRLLPNWWLSTGLLEAAHAHVGGQQYSWSGSVLLLGVLISNALLLVLIVAKLGGRLLRPAYSRISGVTSTHRKAGAARVDRIVDRLLFAFRPPMRRLLLKDFRTFRRDPVQWSQFLIFFGLLALYFVNIRRFQYAQSLAGWMNMIGFLNVAVVGLILSTFTTRFIFPMISLEGRRFWILGTLPVSRSAILWSKFVFACFGSLPLCSLLILLSDATLGILTRHPVAAIVHQVECWTLCISLSALAVGLGARLPNMREPSPAKIAAGFGGTLTLVISALLIIAVTAVTSVPTYFWVQRQVSTSYAGSASIAWWQPGSLTLVVLGTLLTVAAGVVFTWLPLSIGFRAFRKLEF